MRIRSWWWLCAALVAGVLIAYGYAQAPQPEPATNGSESAPPVIFTSNQDHQNMMDQLGIRKLREAPSGDENAPNPANYDESLASPYSSLPDVLTLRDGRRVTTAAEWWRERRPEVMTMFDQEVYGKVPDITPKVTWKVVVIDHEFVAHKLVIAKQLVGHVDDSAYPMIHVNIAMTLVTPATSSKPVPVLMMFRRAVLPAPTSPPPQDLARVNAALRSLLAERDPSLKEVFEHYPAYEPLATASDPFTSVAASASEDLPFTEQLLADGWGYALIDPASIQADNGAGLTRGIIGLVNHGQPRKPMDWGALRAWAWGAGRALDYLETDSAVDAKHVGIEGVSRFGKAALVTLAYDQRFAMGLIGSSGEGGAKLYRHNFGEAVENLTGSEYYWMAGNFMKYGAAESTFGSKNAGDLPVDAHELIALCAPRLTFISYGSPAAGDVRWLDQRGSFMAAVAAQEVFELLGARGLGVINDYKSASMPPIGVEIGGQLAWRQHEGGHTDQPNAKYFIRWADSYIRNEVP